MDLVVGRVVKPHGVRGELVIDVRTDSPEDRFAPGIALGVRGSARTLTIAAARPHTGRLLVFFDGVGTREAAEELRGTLLTVEVDRLPPIDDPDEFYDHQLEGLVVELQDGTAVGTVREIAHGPGGELLVVKAEDGREVLIPFVEQIVPTVDVEGGRVVIDPPDGLLTIE
ncbi:ribosome maturation factor RimM [Allokutzneria sp. A3M-2-11 16]|uniref:ribosome maturation factor RimM n=1 Tax=Allokutzneria sp. A3M-2-11 16 TaxID=2962043 RepID=UPI0020B8DA61|nr:ribosome maturation factor RimM [Allokutzneria sp. A3M-2-11 16]MCP3797998.1 ribosome maturation factor RimM [Allokutzneria sp. A3M-2-11 16]